MINIITNVNPKITVELVSNSALFDKKEICFSQKEAEDLYVDLLTVPSNKWLEIDTLKKAFDEYDDEFFEQNDRYYIRIDFNDEFLKQMRDKTLLSKI